MDMDRRTSLGLMAALASIGFAPASAAGEEEFTLEFGEAKPFSADAVKQLAKSMAERGYKPGPRVPEEWLKLDYDTFRNIWFDTKKSVWNETNRPQRIDLFVAGLYFPTPVSINVADGDQARAVKFDMRAFTTTDQFPQLPTEGMGYSGFRLRTEFETPGFKTEYAVFQGASYFRAIGRGETYGLSSRGLALNTGDPEGEEFPEFRNFWIEAPEPGATDIIVHALLEGPSVCGAYRFRINPGDTTVMDVEATLYPRVDLDHVGIAAETSMFLFDETNRAMFDDFRASVHDSDGLLIKNGAGEVLWRPLANHKTLQASFFVDDNPQGFGLMQRARDLDDFADLHSKYHNRPGLWVEPLEAWGKGSVQLVEIPTDKEIYDNIVAYWRPREPLKAGQEYTYTYRLHWGAMAPTARDVAPVLNTRMGKRVFEEGRIAAIDFGPHPDWPEDIDEIVIFISSNRGRVSEGILHRNPSTGGYRLDFTYDPGGARMMEMRAQLRHNDQNISEVWMYRWTA